MGCSFLINYFNRQQSHFNCFFTSISALTNSPFSNVKLIEALNFEELEKIVSHSKLLISCHGAISHVASAYNIKQIDIIDINSKEPYSNWTDHFRNYSSIYRENFPNLSYKILNNDYFSQI